LGKGGGEKRKEKGRIREGGKVRARIYTERKSKYERMKIGSYKGNLLIVIELPHTTN